MKIFGWIAALCFSICAIPQARLSIRKGHSHGVSKLTLWLWELGESSLLIYGIWGLGVEWPIIMNATASLICVSIILFYSYFEVKK